MRQCLPQQQEKMEGMLSWACQECTYENEAHRVKCEMCETLRTNEQEEREVQLAMKLSLQKPREILWEP